MKEFICLLATPLPSFLKVRLYRLLGARIAEGARIGAFTVLVAGHIDLGPYSCIKALSIIFGLSRLRIGAYGGISNLCVVNGRSSLEIGHRSFISAGCMIDVHAPVSLGEYSAVGPRSTVMTHGVFWPTSWGFSRKLGPVCIGDLVWISNNCKIGAGVEIKAETLLLPNSTVTSSVESTGVVFDSTIHRKVFPLQFVRKGISRDGMKSYIHQVVEEYFREKLQPRGFTCERDGEQYNLTRRSNAIRISVVEPMDETPSCSNAWLFGYDVLDETLRGGRGVAALDFRRLLHSPWPTRELRKVLTFLREMWGLRFADYRYRDVFRLEPPEFVLD